jgi:hypothetical protein
MSFFDGLNLDPTPKPRPTDPADVFKRLNLRRSGIENLWDTQGEALREWNEHRAASDVVVEMNTGGGKTLVGLILAQSLGHELDRGVVYLCPTRQLVSQVAARARDVGAPVATYYGGEGWTDRDVFTAASGPCVTTYAALFNGRSVFRSNDVDVGALVLDDAHVAEQAIRGQFTLSLPVDSAAAKAVLELVGRDIGDGHNAVEVHRVLDGYSQSVLYVPSYAVYRMGAEIRKALLDNNVDDAPRTLFAWEHLKDRVELCNIMVGRGRVEIAPPVLPLWAVAPFRDAQRRVYLTATAPTAPEFGRTFGAGDPVRVSPGGRSGDAQRFFVFPPGDNDDAQRTAAKALVEDRKALVIVPTKSAAEDWGAENYDGNEAAESIAEFAEASDPRTLVLAARYDGIDLPGDACQALVLDGVPRGDTLFDLFREEALRSESVRGPRTAVRVTQSLGRIFRSNNDHGAVIVVGDALRSWLQAPRNLKLLPARVQRQVAFGQAVAKSADPDRLDEAIRSVIEGDETFEAQYQTYMERADTFEAPEPPPWLAKAYRREHAGYRLLWNGHAGDAASKFAQAYDLARTDDVGLGAWFLHLSGLALLADGDENGARERFLRAAHDRAPLGRFGAGSVLGEGAEPTDQARAVETVMAGSTNAMNAALAKVEGNLLYGEANTTAAEEAVYELGRLLGLTASRPDTKGEDSTGPDVIWKAPPSAHVEDAPTGAAFELKTGKESNSVYSKNEDVAQFHDHVQYLVDNHPDDTFFRRIVGRLLPVAAEANPPEGLCVTPLEPLHDLVGRVASLYRQLGPERVAGGHAEKGVSFAQRVQGWLERDGLAWPQCIEGLDATPIRDLQERKGT